MSTTVHGKPSFPILAALLLAAFAFALSQTMIAPAIPSIAREYDTSIGSSTWLLTGYLLSASVATPLAGKLGDVFGKARVLVILLAMFAVGSVICALGSSIEALIAGRVVMGVAGGVFPLSFGIINDELKAENRAVAIGLMSAMFGIGGGIGLPLAGVIVDHAHISLLFWLGLIAVPAAIAIRVYVPPSPKRERTRIDWRGAAVLSVGLTGLLYGITRANEWGWTSASFLGLLGGSLAVLAAWVWLELRTDQPLVDIRVLRQRAVLSTNVSTFFIGMAMFGSFLLTPQFVQAPEASGYGFGFSVTTAGLIMLPSSVAMLFAGPLGGHLGNRVGFRSVLAIGSAFAVAAFVLLAVVHSAAWHFALSGVLIGIGISFAFSSVANLIVGSVDRRDVGIATGINAIMRTVGGAFGSALVTALLTAETIAGTPIPTETAYEEAFVLSSIVALLALAAAFAVPKARAAGGPPQPAPVDRREAVRV